jgi:hypothetical protein
MGLYPLLYSPTYTSVHFEAPTSPWRWWQHGLPKRWYPTTSLHGVTTRKTMTSIFIAVKVKLSLVFFFCWSSRHEGVLRSGGIAPSVLDSALDGGEWSASCPGRFTPRERAPGTHWIGGWVGPRAGEDAVVRRKIPSPYRDSKPRSYSL